MSDDDTRLQVLEARIRELCAQVMASEKEEEMRSLCRELRAKLTEQIELLRGRVAELKSKEKDRLARE